jgi:hypothetical protein
MLGSGGPFFLIHPVMLFVAQFPLCDARRFAVEEYPRLRTPDWPLPDPDRPDFVRCFGVVKRRRRGGHLVFSDEAFFCSANRAVRFVNLEKQRLDGTDAHAMPRCAFRRLFYDGTAVVRFEIGVVVRGISTELTWKEALLAALSFFNLPIKITCLGGDPTSCQLRDVRSPLRKLYMSVTTPGSPSIDSTLDKHLAAGEPILMIEYEEDELNGPPKQSMRVAEHVMEESGLGHMWVEHAGRRTGLWFVEKDAGDPRRTRNLRIGLLRLHAEHQALKHVLRLLRQGTLNYQRGAAGSDALDAYLSRATRFLSSERRAGFSPLAISELMAAYDGLANPDERRLLKENLADVRHQIRLKVERHIEAVSSRTGEKVTYYHVEGDLVMKKEGDLSVTAGGDIINSQIAGEIRDSFNNSFNKIRDSAVPGDVKQALEDLHARVQELTAKLEDENKEQVARDLDNFVEEATSKNPRKGFLEATGEGLIEAAKTVAEMAPSITTAVKAVIALLAF